MMDTLHTNIVHKQIQYNNNYLRILSVFERESLAQQFRAFQWQYDYAIVSNIYYIPYQQRKPNVQYF